MYTDYGYLKEADFYNRFRNGSMPLGIAHYSTYLTIYSAAPEIQGRWSIANVPGFTEDNNYVAGGGTGCAIVKRSKHHKEAWEFLNKRGYKMKMNFWVRILVIVLIVAMIIPTIAYIMMYSVL